MIDRALENRRLNYRLSRRSEHPWQVTIDDILITKNIIDLSVSGLCLKAPEYFKVVPGQLINLVLSLKPGDTYECQGRVQWVKAEKENSGPTSLVGIKFGKLPAWLDSLIVQEIHQDVLKARWEGLDFKDETPGFKSMRQVGLPPHLDHRLLILLRQIFTVGLIAAFFMAAHLYGKEHPEDSIEQHFNQGLAKKLGHR